MSRPPQPLPHVLRGPFHVRDAAALGLTRDRLRGTDLYRPTHGVRSTESVAGVREGARALLCALSAPFAFSHLTAARIWNLPVRSDWDPAEPYDVMHGTGTAHARRIGVHGHRGLELRESVLLDSIPVTSPAWTWVDLASVRGTTPQELVVAGDTFAFRRPELLDELRLLVSALHRRRGVVALRQAVEDIRAGCASPGETRSRLAFAEAALPEPELNVDVFDNDGAFVARVDFLWRSAKVVVEYEGDHHRTDRIQWMRDIERVRDLEALGYTVIRITSRDLADSRARATLMSRLHALVGG